MATLIRLLLVSQYLLFICLLTICTIATSNTNAPSILVELIPINNLNEMFEKTAFKFTCQASFAENVEIDHEKMELYVLGPEAARTANTTDGNSEEHEQPEVLLDKENSGDICAEDCIGLGNNKSPCRQFRSVTKFSCLKKCIDNSTSKRCSYLLGTLPLEINATLLRCGFNGYFSDWTLLNVQVVPEIKSVDLLNVSSKVQVVSTGGQSAMLYENDEAQLTLQCQARAAHAITVLWLFESNRNINVTWIKRKETVEENHLLWTSNITVPLSRNYSGRYICSLANANSSKTQSYELITYYGQSELPEVTINPLTTQVGSQKNITCTFSDRFPIPNIKWQVYVPGQEWRNLQQNDPSYRIVTQKFQNLKNLSMKSISSRSELQFTVNVTHLLQAFRCQFKAANGITYESQNLSLSEIYFEGVYTTNINQNQSYFHMIRIDANENAIRFSARHAEDIYTNWAVLSGPDEISDFSEGLANSAKEMFGLSVSSFQKTNITMDNGASVLQFRFQRHGQVSVKNLRLNKDENTATNIFNNLDAKLNLFPQRVTNLDEKVNLLAQRVMILENRSQLQLEKSQNISNQILASLRVLERQIKDLENDTIFRNRVLNASVEQMISTKFTFYTTGKYYFSFTQSKATKIANDGCETIWASLTFSGLREEKFDLQIINAVTSSDLFIGVSLQSYLGATSATASEWLVDCGGRSLKKPGGDISSWWSGCTTGDVVSVIYNPFRKDLKFLKNQVMVGTTVSMVGYLYDYQISLLRPAVNIHEVGVSVQFI